MPKRDIVVQWVRKQFTERPYRCFSAGECAREAGVSVNTAKKYLRELVTGEYGVYDVQVELRNGIVMTCYAFTNVRED